MKVMLMSVVAALVLGAGAAYLLNVEQRSAFQAYSTEGARVDDPGHNLVGKSWNGQVSPSNPGEPRGIAGSS